MVVLLKSLGIFLIGCLVGAVSCYIGVKSRYKQKNVKKNNTEIKNPENKDSK